MTQIKKKKKKKKKKKRFAVYPNNLVSSLSLLGYSLTINNFNSIKRNNFIKIQSTFCQPNQMGQSLTLCKGRLFYILQGNQIKGHLKCPYSISSNILPIQLRGSSNPWRLN